MYLTEAEYKDIKGCESPPDYRSLEYKSRMLVDTYTFGRLKSFDVVPEEVKMLMAEIICCTAKNESAEVASESNDGVSVTYREHSKTYEEICDELIRTYLDGVHTNDGTPVLYRGVSGVV